MDPTPPIAPVAKEERVLTPAELDARLPMERFLEGVAIETTRFTGSRIGGLWTYSSNTPREFRFQPDSGEGSGVYLENEITAVTIDGVKYQIKHSPAPLLATSEDPAIRLGEVRDYFERFVTTGDHVTLRPRQEDSTYTGRLLTLNAPMAFAEFIHPDSGEPRKIYLIRIESIIDVVPDDSILEIHREENLIALGMLREMEKHGDNARFELDLEFGKACQVMIHTDPNKTGPDAVIGFSDLESGESPELDRKITGFREIFPDGDHFDDFDAELPAEPQVTPEEILAAETERIVDSRDRGTEIRVVFSRIAKDSDRVTGVLDRRGRVLEYDEGTKRGSFKSETDTLRFELEEIETGDRTAYRFRTLSREKGAGPSNGKKLLAEEEKLVGLVASGEITSVTLRDGAQSFTRKGTIESYNRKIHLGVFRGVRGDSFIFALTDNGNAKPIYRAITYEDAKERGFKGPNPCIQKETGGEPEGGNPPEGDKPSGARSSKRRTSDAPAPKGRQRRGSSDKIYDMLLGSHTGQKATVFFNDGRVISGALAFNPWKGTGRVINIDQEISVDFSVDELRDLKL